MSRLAAGRLGPATVLYLTLPAFFFAFGWLRPSFSAASLIVLSGVAFSLVRDLARKSSEAVAGASRGRGRGLLASGWVYQLPALLFILLWVSLSGAGGFGFQHRDYKASNAMFHDLIEQRWPITVATAEGEQNIVYYVAYYLPAAAAGKVFGWKAANVALFLWTTLGTMLAFSWFRRLAQNRTEGGALWHLLMAALFCAAGGLDLLGSLLFRNELLGISSENEWWAGYFQYSSNTTLLYWVPQQAIPAWLAAGLVAQAGTNRTVWRYLGIALAVLPLWTPFGFLGILPFLPIAIVEMRMSGQVLSKWSGATVAAVLGAAYIGATHLLYLGSNSFRFPLGILWNMVEDHRQYVRTLLSFWWLEFGLVALLLGLLILARRMRRLGPEANPRQNPRKGENANMSSRGLDVSPAEIRRLVVALIVLTCLPLFSIGVYNDLAMRASIPSLFLLWALVAKAISSVERRANAATRAIIALLVIVVVVGAHPAAVNVRDAIAGYHLGPPAESSVLTTAEANSPQIVIQRLGDKAALFNRFMAR